MSNLEIKISIVIPIYNESKNIKILFDEIKNSIKNNIEYEIIFVNDNSNDDSYIYLNQLKSHKKLKIINNKYRSGQSRSIYNGIINSTYETIVTLDGDCQNDPGDINNLVLTFFENVNLKLIAGIRGKRKDSALKIISSKIANYVRNLFLNDNCPDTGCSLKVFDKKIFLNFQFFDGIHRFLPALFVGFDHQVKYIKVNHRNRKFGKSNYGTIKRLIDGIKHIFLVKKMISKKNNV